MPMVDEENKNVCSDAISLTLAWCEGKVTAQECFKAQAQLNASRPIYSDSGPNYGAMHAIADAVCAIKNPVFALDAASFILSNFNVGLCNTVLNDTTPVAVEFLVALLDEHARLTAHKPLPVDLRGLDTLVPVVSASAK